MQTPANFLLPVSMAAHTFPGWTNCPWIYLFFSFSFLSPAKQVALLVSFWLHLTDCISRLDRDDRMSFLPGAWPWVGDTVPGLSLVFWPISDYVHAYLRVWQRQCGPLMWSQEAGGPEIQPDCVNNLWQATVDLGWDHKILVSYFPQILKCGPPLCYITLILQTPE